MIGQGLDLTLKVTIGPGHAALGPSRDRRLLHGAGVCGHGFF